MWSKNQEGRTTLHLEANSDPGKRCRCVEKGRAIEPALILFFFLIHQLNEKKKKATAGRRLLLQLNQQLVFFIICMSELVAAPDDPFDSEKKSY